ncbi:DsrE family protein [Marinomonas epiphytica]
MKSTLIHLTSAPLSNLACKEGLDLALVLGTFEQKVDLCLSGSALALLNSEQQPKPEQGKNLHKLLAGLEFYDIENVYIKQSNAPTENTIWPGTTQLSSADWQGLFAQYHQIFRF